MEKSNRQPLGIALDSGVSTEKSIGAANHVDPRRDAAAGLQAAEREHDQGSREGW